MVPNLLLSSSSNAEFRVFHLLKDVDIGQGWTAFHSLNCSEHAYKRWAEIDFFIVGPSGMLVVEVKGGRVQCKEGLWIYTDRFNRSRTSSEGPYGQARSAMYAVRGMLADRYKLGAIAAKSPFGFGVMFPDIDWDVDTPEAPAEITADRSMLLTSQATGRYLKHLVHHWREKHPNASTLDDDELKTLRQQLRPDVDVYPPLSLRIGTALQQMQHLTEEQYERLECIEQNDRVIVSGGAGTGKTFLMMQLARRQAASGKSVTVVVHSELLAAHLRKAAVPNVTITTLSTEANPSRRPADLLLVDEGQDLMTFDALNALSEAVIGGLDAGRWCWFMDENNQAGIAGTFDPEAFEYLQSGLATGKPVRLPLRRNCRNTKEIIRQVQLWTGADMGKTEVSGFGTRPEMVIVHQNDAPETIIEPVLRKTLDDGSAADDIGIVTASITQPAFFSRLAPALRRALTPLSVATVAGDLTGRILWGPAASWKGLERPITLVLAFEQSLALPDAAFYVASTRPNYGLWVFASPQLARTLADNQRSRVDQPSNGLKA